MQYDMATIYDETKIVIDGTIDTNRSDFLEILSKGDLIKSEGKWFCFEKKIITNSNVILIVNELDNEMIVERHEQS